MMTEKNELEVVVMKKMPTLYERVFDDHEIVEIKSNIHRGV